MITKKCTKCKLVLPIDSFYCDVRIKTDGHYAHCKKCHGGMSTKWSKTNSKRVNELSCAWSKLNPNKVQAKLRRLRSDPAYRKKTNQWNANYKKRNSHKINAINAGRRALLLHATPPWLTTEMKWDIEFMYYIRSQMKEPEKWNVDHYWPLDGAVTNCNGLHVPWNLRLIPSSDNVSKLNRAPLLLP